MPGDYSYLEKGEIFVTSYWGTVSLVDILDTITRRVQELPHHHAKANVVDTSNAKWTEVPPNYVHQEVQRLRPAFGPPKVPSVFITPGEFFYGFARMYAIVQIVYANATVEVVRSWAEASKLLGIDLKEAEAWSRERAATDIHEQVTRPHGSPR